jgi:hypothetical protein
MKQTTIINKIIRPPILFIIELLSCFVFSTCKKNIVCCIIVVIEVVVGDDAIFVEVASTVLTFVLKESKKLLISFEIIL